MAYQIRYTDTTISRKTIHSSRPAIKWGVIFFVIIISGCLLQQKSIQNLLIPGDPEITKAAFSSFTEELKEGERFVDAAAEFCREIIESDSFE